MPIVPTVLPDGERIRQAREDLGLSHADVVALMPPITRHPKTIEVLERQAGKKKLVSKSLLQEVADVLGRPVDEFIKAGEAA